MKERNISKFLFILVAVLSVASIIVALISGEVSVASYVLVEIEVIIFALVMAFISSRTKTTEDEQKFDFIGVKRWQNLFCNVIVDK